MSRDEYDIVGQTTKPVADFGAPSEDSPPPVRRALSMSMLNTALSKIGGLATGIILARILVPEEFGVYAVALVALNAVLSFNELGVSLAIVRWRGDPREIAPTVTTISFVSSAILYAGCWAGAPRFAELMNAPDATNVVRLLCLSVLVDAATAVASQQVNREFRQGARLVVDLLNLAATTALTVGLALSGFGAWSLAWGQLVGNVISAGLLFYVVRAWPRPGFEASQARQLLAFGLPLAGASLLTFAMLNIDYIVIGWRLDATALGLYLMAFNVSSWPVSTFSMVVRRVSLAAFSRTQGDQVRTEATFVRFATLLALAAVPACIMLSGLATSTVLTLYGRPWMAAAAALQYLAVLGLVRVFGELAYDLLVSRGQVRLCMAIHIVWLVGLVAVLPLAAIADGIRGVAVGQAVVAGAVVLPLFLVAVVRAGVKFRPLVRALARPLIGGGLLILVLEAVELLIPPSVTQLAIGAAVGGAAYLSVIWPMRRLLTAGRQTSVSATSSEPTLGTDR